MGKISYRQLLVLVARLVLAGTFVMAALPKIKDPVGFAESVSAFRIIGPELSNWVALFLPWLELILWPGVTPWLAASLRCPQKLRRRLRWRVTLVR